MKPALLSASSALCLVAAAGVVLTASPAAAAQSPHISEIAYTLTDDFIEIAAAPGTDLSGWTVGSVTRGGSVNGADNSTTLAQGTTVSESGALAIKVPITNSVNTGTGADGSFGSSAFAIDASGALVSFEQIGGVAGGKGVTGQASTLTPAAVVGKDATPTAATAASGQSIQLVNGAWTSAAPTPDALPGGSSEQPAPIPADVTSIDKIQGTGDVSPVQGTTVRTQGVVTAAYPTGGLNGYYIQTPGSGGSDDATPGASDGIFVYSPDTVKNVKIGEHVEVTGAVSERYGQTQITVPGSGFTASSDPAANPKPVESNFPQDPAKREALEGMLLQPSGELTVTDNYDTNSYGEVVLATGTGTLRQATDVARPGSDEAKKIEAENLARQVILDDGATVNYLQKDRDVALPYLTSTSPVRVGATATFTSPVVLGYDHSSWRFQPLTRLTGDNAESTQPVSFSNTRTDAPRAVGGQVTLASFNVLSYFTTTGDTLSGCTYYDDRAGNHITVRGGCDARGAATQPSLKRQETKIVTAINKLDASVVSLMEIENSARFGENRDAALKTLVDRLNEAAGLQKWALVPSPTKVPASEDVIRLAQIYQPAEVAVQGTATILDDTDAFSNARQPLAQAFAPRDATGEVEKNKTFVTVSNHFKSKGSGSGEGNADSGDGQGASNADRVKQAKSLVNFATEQQKAAGSNYVYLLGDFNAYTQEDPMQVLYDAGYKDVVSQKTDKSTYVFNGRTGSLDHVLALSTSGAAGEQGAGQGRSAAGEREAVPSSAFDAITGADVWNINSVESQATEYSRFNYNVSDLYAPDQFRASDHDPVLVGLFASADDSSTSPEPNPGETTPGESNPNEPGQGETTPGQSESSEPGATNDPSADPSENAQAKDDDSSGHSDPRTDGQAKGDLPRTGQELGLPLLVAGGLMLLGVIALLAARRRWTGVSRH